MILAKEDPLGDREGHDPRYDDIYLGHFATQGKKVDARCLCSPSPYLFGVRFDSHPYPGTAGATDRQNYGFCPPIQLGLASPSRASSLLKGRIAAEYSLDSHGHIRLTL